jgi:adenosine deaminase
VIKSSESTSHTLGFCSALQSGDLSAIQRVPKSDLHNHSILGTRLGNVEHWLGRTLPHPPKRMASLDAMITFAHQELYPHTDTLAGFRFTAQSALQDAREDGVTVLEMSLDVRFISLFQNDPDDFFAFIADLVDTNKEHIDFRPEIGMSKDRFDPEQLRLAHLCIRSGVFQSIDLYGNETAQLPDAYREIYADARKLGLKLKAHAGEFSGPEYISETLDILHVDEIQHGIASATSQPLMQRLQREGIRLNVCPSSNVALGVVDDIAHHPIRVLVDNGVSVTINTDDLMIFDQSVSQEYLLLYQSGVLTAEELDQIRLGGIAAP